MSKTDWKSKAIEKTRENKQLKKRNKELSKSRDEWKTKSMGHKARAYKSEADLMKLKKKLIEMTDF